MAEERRQSHKDFISALNESTQALGDRFDTRLEAHAKEARQANAEVKEALSAGSARIDGLTERLTEHGKKITEMAESQGAMKSSIESQQNQNKDQYDRISELERAVAVAEVKDDPKPAWWLQVMNSKGFWGVCGVIAIAMIVGVINHDDFVALRSWLD